MGLMKNFSGCHYPCHAIICSLETIILKSNICKNKSGFTMSDKSIQAGLERTRLLGRSQFLTKEESEAIGVSGASILVDGAHTEASAKGLSEVIRMAYPDGLLAFVVGMASDKDHLAFARQLLTGRRPDIVLLTEVSIAGGKSRTTPASILKDAWVRTATNLGLDIMDLGMIDEEPRLQIPAPDKSMIFAAFQNLPICNSIKVADHFLKSRERDEPALIVVTGSLHVVSSALAAVHH